MSTQTGTISFSNNVDANVGLRCPSARDSTEVCIENDPIDSQRSASSAYGNAATGTGYHRGRIDSNHAWMSVTNDVNQWYQMDLGSSTSVGGIVVRGRADAAQWVTHVKVKYLQNSQWKWVDNGKKFTANTDQTTAVTIHFDTKVQTNSVRVLPQAWVGHISMRVAVWQCPEVTSSYVREKGYYCSNNAEFLQEFIPQGQSTDAYQVSLRACEDYCASADTCWGCSIICEQPNVCQFNAIASCVSRVSFSGKITGDITHKADGGLYTTSEDNQYYLKICGNNMATSETSVKGWCERVSFEAQDDGSYGIYTYTQIGNAKYYLRVAGNNQATSRTSVSSWGERFFLEAQNDGFYGIYTKNGNSKFYLSVCGDDQATSKRSVEGWCEKFQLAG